MASQTPLTFSAQILAESPYEVLQKYGGIKVEIASDTHVQVTTSESVFTVPKAWFLISVNEMLGKLGLVNSKHYNKVLASDLNLDRIGLAAQLQVPNEGDLAQLETDLQLELENRHAFDPTTPLDEMVSFVGECAKAVHDTPEYSFDDLKTIIIAFNPKDYFVRSDRKFSDEEMDFLRAGNKEKRTAPTIRQFSFINPVSMKPVFYVSTGHPGRIPSFENWIGVGHYLRAKLNFLPLAQAATPMLTVQPPATQSVLDLGGKYDPIPLIEQALDNHTETFFYMNNEKAAADFFASINKEIERGQSTKNLLKQFYPGEQVDIWEFFNRVKRIVGVGSDIFPYGRDQSKANKMKAIHALTTYFRAKSHFVLKGDKLEKKDVNAAAKKDTSKLEDLLGDFL